MDFAATGDDGLDAEIAAAAAKAGHASARAYLLALHAAQAGAARREPAAADYGAVETFHETGGGRMLLGDCRAFMSGPCRPDSVDLVMTSPPFALLRRKDYGNADAGDYCAAFRPFAEGFRRVLKDSGSLVIDIGGAWNKGLPTRSLYHFKLLVMLVEEYGFHLAQEHYWWNPAKLPSPIEWVNIRKVRAKDAVNCVWWLSKTPFPKASVRRVLQPYSDSMRGLIAKGQPFCGGGRNRAEAGLAVARPSGHGLSLRTASDAGGAIPPNLLAIANTESNGRYQQHCRAAGVPAHPARFPARLPEYFIRMLTDPGDMVFDPFAGSCVTGAVAESLGRRWVCTEASAEYLRGAVGRFPVEPRPVGGGAYSAHQPCSLALGDEEALVADGGAARPRGKGW